MEYNKDNSILEIKIEEHLAKLHKNKIYMQQAKIIAEAKQKLGRTEKWRQLQSQRQKVFVVKTMRPQETKPQVQSPLDRKHLMHIINRALFLQHIIIRLNETLGKYSRLPLLCIFFQCGLAIVFNSYNLVLFLLGAALGPKSVDSMRIAMLLFFYGFQITVSFLDTMLTVIVHQWVHANIRRTGSIMDELNLYISDDSIKLRLGQFSAFVYNNLRQFSIYGLYIMDGSFISSLIAGTTTYIIILIQYSGDGEICKHPANETKA